MENLSLCTGIGEKKVLRMYATFNDEILKPKQETKKQTNEEEAVEAVLIVEEEEEMEEKEDE